MKKEELDKIKVGSVLHTSYGYDMTLNSFCVVLEHTGKSMLCQLVELETVSGSPYEPGGSTVLPNTEYRKGKPFRVRIYKGKNEDEPYYWLTGSYPHVIFDDGRESKIKGNWWVHDEKKEGYYENHMD